jgi:hypothetical protein
MNNIISTPLIFPKVEPNNWDEWWNVWKQNSKTLLKVTKNHNRLQAPWKGMDIFIAKGVDPINITGYVAPYVDCSNLFSTLFDNIDQLPIDVRVIRAVSSFQKVYPHSDLTTESFSVRSLLYDNNLKSTFYYNFDDKQVYQQLPSDSNTWGYWDHKCKHGTDYHAGYFKILLMYIGEEKLNIDISKSINHYADLVIK